MQKLFLIIFDNSISKYINIRPDLLEIFDRITGVWFFETQCNKLRWEACSAVPNMFTYIQYYVKQ